jgi:hypothetical protein
MHEAAADFRTRHDAFDISGGDVTVEEVRP